MATIVAAAGGGAWTVGGTWVGGVAPTAADDAQLAVTSGNVTIDTGAVCRSIDCTGYLGVLTHTAGVNFQIGDGTAGASNKALTFVATMTYTLGDVATSLITFISTSATAQDVNFAGLTTGNVTFNAASNGSWKYTGTHNTGVTAILTLTKGTLNLNGQTLSVGKLDSSGALTRTLTLGASNITLTGSSLTAWNVANNGITFSGASSTLTFTGSTVTFNGGSGLTYGTVIATGAGIFTMSNATPCTTLTRTGTTAKTDAISFSSTGVTVTTFNINGNSTINRLQVLSGSLGAARTITAATVNASYVDLQDITGAGAASWDLSAITGGSGDCGGNTLKALGTAAFTPAATQTATVASGTKTWSDVTIWTSRIPLPQDDVSMASVTGGTITADMPRLGKSIDWTGATGTPSWGITSTTTTIFGSITLITGMTFTGVNAIILAGRSSFTLTSAGQNYPTNITISNPTGTYTLNDALSLTNTLTLSQGGFNANNFNVTSNIFTSNNTNTRSITMGTGTWTHSNSAGPWVLTTTTGLTFSGASSTILITNSAATTRTFAGGSLTYGTISYIVSTANTGILVFTGANTIANLNVYNPTGVRTVTFPSATTTTITGTFNVQGRDGAGNQVTINSSTPASAATISKASGIVSCNYLSIQDSTATGGATFYAGDNSTSVSNNSGWIFTSAPNVDPGGGTALLLGV